VDRDDLDRYLRGIGYPIERATGSDGQEYLVVRDVGIQMGPLVGKVCDVAIQLLNAVPFTMPAAIQVRPALLPMQGGEPYGTQASPLGEGWQYWSRRFDGIPNPAAIWAAVLKILNQAPS
jgi:hypothetical protein